MSPETTTSPRPICPKCQLPVNEHEPVIFHEGRSYHRGCAPLPSSSGDKDDPYIDSTPIAI